MTGCAELCLYLTTSLSWGFSPQVVSFHPVGVRQCFSFASERLVGWNQFPCWRTVNVVQSPYNYRYRQIWYIAYPGGDQIANIPPHGPQRDDEWNGTTVFKRVQEGILKIDKLGSVNPARGKGATFKFSGPCSEIRPAKLTNHTARTN